MDIYKLLNFSVFLNGKNISYRIFTFLLKAAGEIKCLFFMKINNLIIFYIVFNLLRYVYFLTRSISIKVNTCILVSYRKLQSSNILIKRKWYSARLQKFKSYNLVFNIFLKNWQMLKMICILPQKLRCY